jgi:HEAT repeat protein
MAALRDKDVGVRSAAAEALGKIEDPRAVEPLLEVLKDKDRTYRGKDHYVLWRAVEALGKIGDPRAVEPLAKALSYRFGEDRDGSIELKVKQAMAEALGKIGDVGARKSLVAALKDDDADVREAAAQALKSLGWKPTKDTHRAWLAFVGGKWDELVSLGAASVEPLVVAARGHRDSKVQAAAVKALLRIGAVAVEPLIVALEDKDGRVRKAAAEALGKIGDARAVEPLTKALWDESWNVRMAAAEALGKIGDPRAAEPLLVALNSWDVGVGLERREAAAQALIQIGPAAVEPLVAALKLRSTGQSNIVEEVLGKIDRNWMRSKAAKEAVPAFVATLRDNKDAGVRSNAARALGEIGDPLAVEPLVAALKDKDGSVRSEAVHALETLGDPRAIEPLVAALKDNEHYVRLSAAKALAKSGDVRAVRPLVDLITHVYTDEAVVLRVSRAEDAVKYLQQVLEHAAADIALDDLRAVASLNDVVEIYYEEKDLDTLKEEWRADCSLVRQLALRELVRRGLVV